MADNRLFVHDMRNLLGIVLGFNALLLKDMQSDDPRRPVMDEIRRASEAAIARLDDWQKPPHSEGDTLN